MKKIAVLFIFFFSLFFSQQKKKNLECYISDNGRSFQREINNIHRITDVFDPFTLFENNIFFDEALNNLFADFQDGNLDPYKKPVIWETGIFKVAFFILFILMVFFLIKIRNFYIERENEKLRIEIENHTKDLVILLDKLQKSKEKLKIKLENQEKLTRLICHDIKSPLRFINLNLKSLISTTDDMEIKESLISTQETTEELYHFVLNSLDYTKLFLTDDEYRETINLRQLIHEKIMIFRNLAAKKNIDIINNVDENIILNNNKALLEMLFHNLIDNAVKYTSIGMVTISAHQKEQNIIVSIQDTGNGMNPEKLGRINSYQNTDVYISKGIGYKIITEIVKKTGAKMKLKNRLGGGLEVKICLMLYN